MSDVHLRKKELMLAFRLGLAAWAAFAVAAGFGIEHAFWASMPVWVVAQPWRGVVFERALWRLLGTLVGGIIGLLMLHFSPSPWVTAGIMALCLGAGGALMHLWHGVKSYFPLMAAITTTVVVIPALVDPAEGMHLALDRLACTFIGGVSVTLIVGLFTPHAGRQAFRDEILAFAENVRTQARAMVEGRNVDTALLLHRAADLETRARLIGAGSLNGYRLLRDCDRALAAAIGLLEASDAAHALGLHEPHLRPKAAALLDGAATSRRGVRGRLARAAENLRAAGAALGTEQETAEVHTRLRLPPRRNLERAVMGGALAFGASLAGSIAILLTESFAAELTAFSIAIFALVLGSLPLPHMLAPKVAIGVVAGVVAGMIYRIGVQPFADGWLLLVLTIMPFIALGALARTNPRTAVYALDANMCFMLASQAGTSAIAPLAVLTDSIAMALGTVLMVLCYMLMPRPGAHLIASTQARLWRDIDLLARRTPLSPDRWAAIAGRRAMNLAVELDKAGEIVPRSVIALMSLGHAVNDLRSAARRAGQLGQCDNLLCGILRARGAQPVPVDATDWVGTSLDREYLELVSALGQVKLADLPAPAQ